MVINIKLTHGIKGIILTVNRMLYISWRGGKMSTLLVIPEFMLFVGFYIDILKLCFI